MPTIPEELLPTSGSAHIKNHQDNQEAEQDRGERDWQAGNLI